MTNTILCAPIQWGKVGMVLGIIAGLAIVFAVLILIVTKICNIKEDEKVMQILEHLAGANCGGCGCSGCSGFAQKLACGEASLSDCKVTSAKEKEAIAILTGLPNDKSVPTVAVVACNGGTNAIDKFEYIGYKDCINQNVIQGGSKLCSSACLGDGTCAKVCPMGAISVNSDKVAFVDKSLCTSCGACINKCPKLIITRIPTTAPVYCACSSKCKGKEVTGVCKVGCIACGICAKVCPNGAITMENNLPKFDFTKCTGCMTCLEKCPRKIILKH